MDLKEVRMAARERMRGYCRVCPVCDGRACAGETPGMGGIGTGRSFQNAVTALSRVHLNMRLLHGVKTPATATVLLGLPLALPVLAAPVGGTAFNMGGFLTEEQYASAIVSGCRTAGIVGCTGDGPLETLYDAGMTAIHAEKGWGVPFVKPWDGPALDAKLDRAAQSECAVVGMDIDAAGLMALVKKGKPVSPKTPEELADIVGRAHARGLKFVLKGVMTPDEAVLAVEAGCDGLVVSSHGGRVLDHMPGTADVLPAIADAVKGRICLLADSGVRDGVDVFKMLALGADGVLVGRPYIIAAMGGEAEGVALLTRELQSQFMQAMLMTGCASVADIGRRHISL